MYSMLLVVLTSLHISASNNSDVVATCFIFVQPHPQYKQMTGVFL